MGVGSAARKVVIEFLGTDKSAGKTASDLEKKFGKLGARMNKVGQVSGRILAGGLLLAGAAAIKAGQAAADDEQAQVKLANALKQGANATDTQIAAVEEWISAQGRALGITDDELRPAFARLAAATGDVESAQRQLSLAMDIAAGTGQSLETVTKAMQKGINGSVGGLGRLGAVTKDASGETMRYEDVLAQLAGKHLNAAAKAADTTAGKQKILQVQFAELQEEIGVRLIPVMSKLATVGLTVVDWIGKNQTLVGTFVATLGGLLAITWGVTKAIQAWTAITKIASAVQAVFTGVQWALNAAMTANPIGLIVIAIAALVAGLVIAYKKSETFRKIVDAAFGAVAKAAKVAVDFIKKHWQTMLAILAGPIGLAVLAIAKNWDKIRAGAAAVKNAIANRMDAAKDAIVQAFTGAREKADNVWEAIKAGFNAVRQKLAGGASDIKQKIASAFNAVLAPVQAVINRIQDLYNKLVSLKNAAGGGGGVKSGPRTADDLRRFGTGLETSAKKGEKALERLRESLSATRELFKSLRESVAGAFTSGLFDSETAADFVANLSSTSGTLGALKKAFKTLTGWGLKPGFLAQLFQSGNAGLILDLANNKASAVEAGSLFGGITEASGALGGMVAEDKYGDEIKALEAQIKELKGGKGGKDRETHIHIHGKLLDPLGTVKALEGYVRQYERATGRALFASPA